MKTIFIFLLCLVSFSSNSQIPGTLDQSFASIGYSTTDFATSDEMSHSVAIQSNGKIVVVGEIGSDIAISSYTSSGSLDTDFGTGGKVITSISSFSSTAYSVKIQQDGKILVAGGAMNTSGSNWDFAILRYDTTGVLDNSFGVGGKVTTALSTGSLAYAMIVQQNGKIVVCGMAFNGTYQSFAVARYNSNGTLDNSFGTAGQTITHIGTGNDFAVCLAQQTDGKIVLAGYTEINSNIDIAVARYDSTGILDNSFGTNGIFTTPLGSGGDIVNGVAIQPDGKIVLAGWSYNGSYDKFCVLRLTNNGNFDTSFGNGGVVVTAIGTLNEGARAVTIESTGKIIVVGFSRNSSNKNTIAILNYNSDGTLNNNFGTSGKTITQIGSSHADANSVALQTDGKIIAAGRVYNGANNDFMVARYNNDLALSIASSELEETFSIYPNPVHTHLTISFQETQENSIINIIDLNGKIVKSINFSGKILIIDKGNISSGLYFLELITGNESIVRKKFIIE